jgi:hypothetical protein
MVLGRDLHRRVRNQIPLIEFLFLTIFFRTLCESPPIISNASDFSRLHNIFTKYGPSPRHCYFLMEPSELRGWEARIPKLLASTLSHQSSFLKDVESGLDYNTQSYNDVSSQLLTIIPGQDRLPKVSIASRHIAGHLYNEAMKKSAEKFWTLFNEFWAISEAHAAAGWLWEAHVVKHDFYSSGIVDAKIEALPRTQNISTSFPLPFPSPAVVYGQPGDLVRLLRKHSAPVLFKPAAKNAATFDAFLITVDGQVTLFQMTIRRQHDVNIRSLDSLWDAISAAAKATKEKGGDSALGALPTVMMKWRVVFVVPKRVGEEWKTEQTVDEGGKRKWGNHITQHVLVLEDES